MSPGQTLALGVFIFALAVFVGFLLISKVPTMLHTPLMSGTNFIHGIVLVGALTVASRRQRHARLHHRRSRRCCSARSTSSAAGSSPTACCRCSGGAPRLMRTSRKRHRNRRITDHDAALRTHNPRLHADRGQLHVRHPAAALAGDGAHGESRCRSWHVARARHHLRAHPQHRQLAADHPADHRRGGRSAPCPRGSCA